MIYMLDTNILIYLIKNKPPAVAVHVNSLDKDAVLCMSFSLMPSYSRVQSVAHGKCRCCAS